MVHAFVETHNMYFITSVITCQLIDRECLAGRENKRCAGRCDDSIGYDQGYDQKSGKRPRPSQELGGRPAHHNAPRAALVSAALCARTDRLRRITLLRAASNLQEWQTWT